MDRFFLRLWFNFLPFSKKNEIKIIKRVENLIAKFTSKVAQKRTVTIKAKVKVDVQIAEKLQCIMNTNKKILDKNLDDYSLKFS